MKVLANTAHFSPAVARWRPRGGLTCGRVVAAWRPRGGRVAAAWRPRGGRVAAAWRPRGGRVGVAGADRDRALSAHLLNFFFFRKATYISLEVTVGFYDPIKK